ncbi:MAG: DUF2461 domain-containing protein [Prevotellaceae bacterium]|jgi:uncharacterized protein (TIGR02453 family)|nr:DUF2461 domain-containing protein [Prevotellaceae bacterium]
MLHKSTIEFLKELEINNNREWFAEHKNLYEEARQDVENFAAEIIPRVSEFDSGILETDPKKCLFRIYRDVRFSADKSPYKTNFGVIIRPSMLYGKYSGYYIHISPQLSFLSAGLYMLPKDAVKQVRHFIYDNFDDLRAILDKNQLKRETGGMQFDADDMLKRMPAGFDSRHPAAEYMRLKHFYMMRTIREPQLLSEDFPDVVADTFQKMYPFSRFINEALDFN